MVRLSCYVLPVSVLLAQSFLLSTCKPSEQLRPTSTQPPPRIASAAKPIRCYCNLPQCEVNQYACTSKISCFSEMTTTRNDGNEPSQSAATSKNAEELIWHGCAEMLVSLRKRRHCQHSTISNNTSSAVATRGAALVTNPADNDEEAENEEESDLEDLEQHDMYEEDSPPPPSASRASAEVDGQHAHSSSPHRYSVLVCCNNMALCNYIESSVELQMPANTKSPPSTLLTDSGQINSDGLGPNPTAMLWNSNLLYEKRPKIGEESASSPPATSRRRRPVMIIQAASGPAAAAPSAVANVPTDHEMLLAYNKYFASSSPPPPSLSPPQHVPSPNGENVAEDNNVFNWLPGMIVVAICLIVWTGIVAAVVCIKQTNGNHSNSNNSGAATAVASAATAGGTMKLPTGGFCDDDDDDEHAGQCDPQNSYRISNNIDAVYDVAMVENETERMRRLRVANYMKQLDVNNINNVRNSSGLYDNAVVVSIPTTRHQQFDPPFVTIRRLNQREDDNDVDSGVIYANNYVVMAQHQQQQTTRAQQHTVQTSRQPHLFCTSTAARAHAQSTVQAPQLGTVTAANLGQSPESGFDTNSSSVDRRATTKKTTQHSQNQQLVEQYELQQLVQRNQQHYHRHQSFWQQQQNASGIDAMVFPPSTTHGTARGGQVNLQRSSAFYHHFSSPQYDDDDDDAENGRISCFSINSSVYSEGFPTTTTSAKTHSHGHAATVIGVCGQNGDEDEDDPQPTPLIIPAHFQMLNASSSTAPKRKNVQRPGWTPTYRPPPPHQQQQNIYDVIDESAVKHHRNSSFALRGHRTAAVPTAFYAHA